jgi:hypothetical protein
MAAEEAADIAELGRTYQRIARSLRQTLALKARFKREREADAKDAAKHATAPATTGPMACARRVREVRAAVARVAWNEAEADDWELHLEALDDILTTEILRDDICAEPLDDHVARVCQALELSPQAARHWRELPDPRGAGPPPDFDSSG